MILFFVKDPRLNAYVAADDYADAIVKWLGRLLFTAGNRHRVSGGRAATLDCKTEPEHVSRLGGTDRYIP